MENTIGDTFKCKNICILYFQPNIYIMTLTSCQVNLLGHWAPRNFMKETECFSSSNSFWNANKSLHLTWGSAHSSLSMCTHWRVLFLLPCLGLDRPEISTQLYDYRGGSGHPKSVTWVTNILTAEIGPKLGVTKSTFPPVLSKVLWTATDRKCGGTESSQMRFFWHFLSWWTAHIRTCSRVSGRRRAIRPPPTREVAARRMGTTLVIPTKEAKMVFPRMAPNLHNPLRMPKAVAL